MYISGPPTTHYYYYTRRTKYTATRACGKRKIIKVLHKTKKIFITQRLIKYMDYTKFLES
jgi:hypothetical protein